MANFFYKNLYRDLFNVCMEIRKVPDGKTFQETLTGPLALYANHAKQFQTVFYVMMYMTHIVLDEYPDFKYTTLDNFMDMYTSVKGEFFLEDVPQIEEYVKKTMIKLF